MNFFKRWDEVRAECRAQKKPELVKPIQELAALAWAGGFVEGYDKARKQTHKEENGDDAKAGSTGI